MQSRLASIIVMGLFITSADVTQAATCSCASVPLLGSMEASSPKGGQWYMNLNYEHHDIDDLVIGSEKVNDETDRERSSQALVMETSYGFNERWSISSLFSYVEHERRVGSNDREISKGIGDALVLVKYTPMQIRVYSKNSISFGLGAKIPLGDDQETQANGIIFAEDMQSSTGAWGVILWAHGAHAFDQAAKAQIYNSISYTSNQENKRDYRFGDEYTYTVGGNYQADAGIGYNVSLRYRKADRDQRNATDIPNTGGEWIDFTPSIQYHLTPELAAKAAVKFPVWRELNDALQFTTSRAYTFSMSYVF